MVSRPDHLSPVRQPVHWGSVRIYKFDSRDRVFHNDYTFCCVEGSQVFGVQVVHCQRVPLLMWFLPPFPLPFCTAGRTRLLSQISHIVCTLSCDVPSCHNCFTSHCATDTFTCRVQFCRKKRTLTRQHQSPSAKVEQCSKPQSFANSGPRCYTRQPTFEGHKDASFVPATVPLVSPNQQW